MTPAKQEKLNQSIQAIAEILHQEANPNPETALASRSACLPLFDGEYTDATP
ncbi:hypothetical protein [Myxosarcina sp. GI1(2024)]